MKKAFKFIGKAILGIIVFLLDNIVTIFVIISCIIGFATNNIVPYLLATIPAVLFSIYIEVKSMAKNQKEFNLMEYKIELIKLRNLRMKEEKETTNGK